MTVKSYSERDAKDLAKGGNIEILGSDRTYVRSVAKKIAEHKNNSGEPIIIEQEELSAGGRRLKRYLPAQFTRRETNATGNNPGTHAPEEA